jgi:hypothetical protein
VLADDTAGEPKSADGQAEMIRTLRSARQSAVKARTQAANQLQALLDTAPENLRHRIVAKLQTQGNSGFVRCLQKKRHATSRISASMTSQPETCHLCHQLSESVHDRYGANICGSCMTLLQFAEVLFEADVTEEEIVPTLAFARYTEMLWPLRNPEKRAAAAHKLVDRYPAFDLVDVANGVPVLRMKHAIVEVVPYRGSHLAKSIRIRVLSRFAEPDEMAKLYWDSCERESLPRHKSSPGSLAWDFERMHLRVDVGPREEIDSNRLHGLLEYPQVRRFAFPLDTVVQERLRALLGQGQAKNLIFAALLSDLGRSSPMSLEKAVIACVLWDVHGERSERGSTSIQRSEEVADLISQLLLVPLDKERITISRNDTAWRDAHKVSDRLDLCKYLLQDIRNRDNPFG